MGAGIMARYGHVVGCRDDLIGRRIDDNRANGCLACSGSGLRLTQG